MLKIGIKIFIKEILILSNLKLDIIDDILDKHLDKFEQVFILRSYDIDYNNEKYVFLGNYILDLAIAYYIRYKFPNIIAYVNI